MSDNTTIALASGGFGLAILALVVSSLREAAAMRRWPVATGRVLSSKVEAYKADAGAGNFGGPRGRLTLYRPVVTYEYEVDGRRFQGQRIAQSPGINRGVPDDAQTVVARYSGGRTIDVHYNPVRPSECVLEPRMATGWVVGLVIALVLLVLAPYLYYR
jgi:hypothetical protein